MSNCHYTMALFDPVLRPMRKAMHLAPSVVYQRSKCVVVGIPN